MSFTELERQVLGTIADGLRGSDPRLASMLTIFSRLAAGEEMPARQTTRVRHGRPATVRAAPGFTNRAERPDLYAHRVTEWRPQTGTDLYKAARRAFSRPSRSLSVIRSVSWRAPASRGRSLPALNGRVHAPAACVLLFRIVRDRRDQARHLRLSPEIGPSTARN